MLVPDSSSKKWRHQPMRQKKLKDKKTAKMAPFTGQQGKTH